MIDDQLGLPDVELVPGRLAWDSAELTYLRDNWRTMTAEQISAGLPLRTRNSVCGMARRLGLPEKPKGPRKAPGSARVRKAYASRGDDATLSRWVKTGRPLAMRQADLPDIPRRAPRPGPWAEAGRSKFSAKGVKPVDQVGNVLVSGHSNAKIGRDVRKGWARGYWIYTLSLEERATCPRSCHHWLTCYGNNMPYAKRVDHRDVAALLIALEREVARLAAVKGRVGVMVRLHALGDFFDVRYVRFWGSLLERYPTLAIYGYTAWPRWSPIGRAIAETKEAYGRRFAVRWSNGRREADCTVPIRHIDEAVNATVCPEQTGRTTACATCGLCWGTTRNIAFLEH